MSAVISASPVLDRDVAAISGWVDAANAERGEALTWHRVCKVAEEVGEVAAEYAACRFGEGDEGDEGELRDELLDVAFSALGALHHLGHGADLVGQMYRTQVVRCQGLGVDPGSSLSTAVRAGARARIRYDDAYFAALVLVGGHVVSTMLGVSGQNPRKGVYASVEDLAAALCSAALDACEMISHRCGFAETFDPQSELEALGQRLVARAGLA